MRSTHRARDRVMVMVVGLLLAAGTSWAGVSPAEVDDFEDGTTELWSEGGLSPNPPFNVANGGPAGAGDNYLQNDAAGTTGAGSRLVMFNIAQWSGDFVSAGVVSITMDMVNFGGAALQMRVAFAGSNGSQFGSTNAESLPADGQWRSLTFDIDEASLTRFTGGDSYNATMSAVTEMRILDAGAGPAWIGDPGDASLGVDNITATIVPVELQRFSID